MGLCKLILVWGCYPWSLKEARVLLVECPRCFKFCLGDQALLGFQSGPTCTKSALAQPCLAPTNLNQTYMPHAGRKWLMAFWGLSGDQHPQDPRVSPPAGPHSLALFSQASHGHSSWPSVLESLARGRRDRAAAFVLQAANPGPKVESLAVFVGWLIVSTFSNTAWLFTPHSSLSLLFSWAPWCSP